MRQRRAEKLAESVRSGTHADLSFAAFHRCTFDGATLAGARLGNAAFHDCRFAGATLSGDTWHRVTFSSCTFDGAVFTVTEASPLPSAPPSMLKPGSPPCA